jgi:arylsulfatase A-like enzyme
MDKPNILFLFTDDQRYRTFGMNNPSIITPNLDRLASEGCLL